MLDKTLQRRLAPQLRRLAQPLARRGLTADSLTWTGFAVGLLAALAIALQAYAAGAVLLLLSRLLDGLDGAVARMTQATDRGAFLDITLDFLFYASIPLAFALAQPAANALAAAVLLAAFIGTGSSFLAYAVLAEKRPSGLAGPSRKGIYFLGGLTEASETLFVFLAMCAWPQHFAALAYGFACLCALTVVTRLHAGWRDFSSRDSS